MRWSNIVRSVVPACAVALMMACAPRTTVQREWSNPSEFVGPMRNVVVLVQNASPSARRSIEDRFTAELASRGTNAKPSYAALGEVSVTAEQAAAMLAARGYDGMLIVRVAPPEKVITEWRNSTPWEHYPQQTQNDSNMSGVQGGMYNQNDVAWDVTVRSDAALWDLRDHNEVWTATLESTNPGNGDLLGRALVNKVMPALEKQGMVPAK